MESELGIPPLHVRRQFLAGKFWFRAKSFQNNKTIMSIEELSSKLITDNPRRKLPLLSIVHNKFNTLHIYSCPLLELFSLDTWVNYIDLDLIIKTSIPKIDLAKRRYDITYLKNTCLHYLTKTYNTFYAIYTDGSKDEIGGGAAYLDPLTGIKLGFKIDSDISIMHIELIAIAEALAYIKSLNNKKFVILTDSKSALQHLARCTSPVRGIPIAYYILKTILDLRRVAKDVHLQWIPSHVQIQGNDAVDLVAKQAISDGIDLNVSCLYTDRLKLIKKWCSDIWREYFDKRAEEKGIWYRTIQPHLPKLIWFQEIHWDRSEIVSAMRLRSGHIPSNKFSFLMKIKSSANCELCGKIDDVQHILMECVRNEGARLAMLGLCKHFEVGLCNSILAEPTSDNARILYHLYRIGIN